MTVSKKDTVSANKKTASQVEAVSTDTVPKRRGRPPKNKGELPLKPQVPIPKTEKKPSKPKKTGINIEIKNHSNVSFHSILFNITLKKGQSCKLYGLTKVQSDHLHKTIKSHCEANLHVTFTLI